MISRYLLRHYYHNKLTWLTVLLLPLSWLFRWLCALRRWLYRVGVLRATRFAIPVIVVGNIAVGGTGKTPLVIALCRYLSQQGYRPAVILRGYGGTSQQPTRVTIDTDPRLVGDEAVLIKHHIDCPVIIARRRVAAVRYVEAFTDCNVVISDDGLQHYALARDIEIAVIDGARRMGNGQCLPAGPLREPVARLAAVDLQVYQGQQAPAGAYALYLLPQCLVSVKDFSTTRALTQPLVQPVHRLAGIGHPERFFKLCDSLQLMGSSHSFADHHFFSVEDVDYPGIVIMTEKDAVKCRAFADERHWFLRVDAKVDTVFFARVKELLHEKC